MDPITLSKLLSVADAIETQSEEGQLTLDKFHNIIDSQGQAKRLERRVRDILRICEAIGWISRSSQDRNQLCLTKDFCKFILAWESGDQLFLMNQGLTSYPPYARFLYCLKHEKRIEIPHSQNRDAQRKLGRELRGKYGITFVAFDTFRSWAVAVGHAYRSPFDEILYWGGDWDANRPTLDSFRRSCGESYRLVDKTSGYANLGRLAHLVCMDLGISFQAFEMKINQFVGTFPGEISLATATIRREISGRFKITSIRPRREIVRERLSAKLQGLEPPQSEWLEHRYLEDGMRVKGRLVKLIRWEESK